MVKDPEILNASDILFDDVISYQVPKYDSPEFWVKDSNIEIENMKVNRKKFFTIFNLCYTNLIKKAKKLELIKVLLLRTPIIKALPLLDS